MDEPIALGLSCARYKLYDWAKQRWLIARLFYSGKRYQHLGPITVQGTVADCPKKTTDGDLVFDLTLPGLQYHCECTPCSDDALKAKVAAIKIGQRYQVSGTHTRDPNHHFGFKNFEGGHDEIHPVTDIQLLGGADKP